MSRLILVSERPFDALNWPLWYYTYPRRVSQFSALTTIRSRSQYIYTSQAVSPQSLHKKEENKRNQKYIKLTWISPSAPKTFTLSSTVSKVSSYIVLFLSTINRTPHPPNPDPRSQNPIPCPFKANRHIPGEPNPIPIPMQKKGKTTQKRTTATAKISAHSPSNPHLLSQCKKKCFPC